MAGAFCWPCWPLTVLQGRGAETQSGCPRGPRLGRGACGDRLGAHLVFRSDDRPELIYPVAARRFGELGHQSRFLGQTEPERTAPLCVRSRDGFQVQASVIFGQVPV